MNLTVVCVAFIFLTLTEAVIRRCSVKKGLWYMYFPGNIAKFLRTPFFIEQLWWLLLLLYEIVLSDN